jgi:hypothetical protein
MAEFPSASYAATMSSGPKAYTSSNNGRHQTIFLSKHMKQGSTTIIGGKMQEILKLVLHYYSVTVHN